VGVFLFGAAMHLGRVGCYFPVPPVSPAAIQIEAFQASGHFPDS
jgi:hypothetical protein